MNLNNRFHDAIGHEIKATNHIIQRKMLETVSKQGLDEITFMHGWIIAYLYDNLNKDIFQKDIETEFGISRSTVTNIVKLMEKKGYITRVSVENDARLKKLVLTDKGKSVKVYFDVSIEENEKLFRKILSLEETEIFLNLIRKLRKGITENN